MRLFYVCITLNSLNTPHCHVFPSLWGNTHQDLDSSPSGQSIPMQSFRAPEEDSLRIDDEELGIHLVHRQKKKCTSRLYKFSTHPITTFFVGIGFMYVGRAVWDSYRIHDEATSGPSFPPSQDHACEGMFSKKDSIDLATHICKQTMDLLLACHSKFSDNNSGEQLHINS